MDRDVRAASRDIFYPTGDKSYSAEAGMNKPDTNRIGLSIILKLSLFDYLQISAELC